MNRPEKAETTRYVAFLRGINVGGHHIVPMKTLAASFTALGFTDVRTLLASGNVIFTAFRIDRGLLEEKIAAKLRKTFGFEIGVLVRTAAELEKLHASNPFKGAPADSKLYVTFLSGKPDRATPLREEEGITIKPGPGREVLSVITPASGSGSVDLMRILEGRFGKGITTRNWQTILRVVGKN